MYQKLIQYMQIALTMAPDQATADMIAQDIMKTMGGGAGVGASMGGVSPEMVQADNVNGLQKKEHGIVTNARSRSNEASQPDSGKVISTKEDKK